MQGFDVARLTNDIAGVVTPWALRLLGASVVLLAGWTVARWTRRAVRRLLERREVDATLVPFTAGLAYYLVLAFVAVAVLGMVGIQTASMIAVLGATGLALGLALQGTLANFAAGVMLRVFRPFKSGDYVEAGGTAGSVQDIGIFTTTLNTPDNVRIVVPNSSVWGSTVKNYSVNPTRRLDMVMGISYGDDIQVAIDTARGVLAGDDRVLDDPAPTVVVGELGSSSVDLLVRP